MKKFTLILGFVFLFGISVSAQTQCPQGFICITQEAANKAAENAKLVPQLQEKNKVLEEQVEVEKGNVKLAQETAKKNEEQLIDRLHKTEIELARTNGQLTAKEAELVRLSAWFDFVMKNGRVKKVGLINLF